MARASDPVASFTIAGVAAAALVAAWLLPWWTMEARAPQYGQRVLVVQVNPTGVSGDVFEIDALGHYVGIRKMETFAELERKLAPFGLAAAIAGLLVTPFLRRRWLRGLAVLPALVIPVAFLADLDVTMNKAANDRDPDAALNLIMGEVETKLFGEYAVAQFKVAAKPAAGLFIAATAGLLALGLIFSVPVPPPPPLGKRKKLVTAGASAALLLAMVSPSRAGTIAEAIAAAEEGGTVVVPAGVHMERLTIAKRITLAGAPGAVIDGGGSGTVVRITAPGVALRGLTLRGSGDEYTGEDAGVRVDHAEGVELSGLVIEDVLFGVFVAQGDRCTIERTHVIGKDLPVARRGDGVRLWYSGGCALRKNVLERSRDLVIWYSKGTVVEDNLVKTSRYGLHFMYSDDNTFRRNRFEDNEVGAAIMYSRGIVLEDNTFSFSNGPSAYGLLVKDADDVFVTHNRFVSNDTALFFDNAPQARDGRVEIKHNLIARNLAGLALQPASSRIVIAGNGFVGNRVQVAVHGTARGDNNVWSEGGRGNYWSDASVYDRDGDGVSEIPYAVEQGFEALPERYPELAFFATTPAAEAIDLASRLFPVFVPRPIATDPHPLASMPPEIDLEAVAEGGRPDRRISLAGASLIAVAAALSAASRRALS